jgi:hypothetical protein
MLCREIIAVRCEIQTKQKYTVRQNVEFFWRVRKIAKSDSYLRDICLSVRPSVRPPARPPAWNNAAPTPRIFMKFCIWELFENLSRELKFH